ncbi:MAG: DNA cytosine methyltransferase [Desulfuromonadaceae bacterium]|nr:DNA cytosine methyltransferase [Desulfuromonadaceae bacterium]MDD2855759.1 DNA cytosine methyltransferase [Desulfuromonadaceae bacterium]
MREIKVGSICSGIEAASVAWKDIGYTFNWFSEINEFPSKLLKFKYPNIPNLGDMCEISSKIRLGLVDVPDLICGGTPCQAFSLAGWKKGLDDDRGNLTLKFVDIIEENDAVRERNGCSATKVFWENVEGVLNDKTNAFGCFVSSLAGLKDELSPSKWPTAGIIHGSKRNIAWRVLDAKYFGLPHQRRRLYVLAGGKDFFPEQALFESSSKNDFTSYPNSSLVFNKDGHSIEVFRNYTDCLYSAYGTKWNGNAAAYNGSLFVVQNGRLRRLTPLECERLMGFPDNYTNLAGAKPTNRYQAVGNSWAVPVVRWIGERIINKSDDSIRFDESQFGLLGRQIVTKEGCFALDLSNGPVHLGDGVIINCSEQPELVQCGNIFDVIDVNAEENFYITPTGCKGILRRRDERQLTINSRLESVLQSISSMWSDEKIESLSRKQTRGRFSQNIERERAEKESSYSLFDMVSI